MPTHLLKSMTGYAQARVEQDGWALRISLRSVNHRFLDVHLRLPDGFEAFEPRIRQAVRDRLRRGHVDVTLHYEPAGPAAVHVHRDVAAAYLGAAEEIRKQFGLKTEPDLAAILRLPGVIGSTALPSDEEAEALGQRISACLEEALGKLEEMRRAEGRHLVEEMSARLRTITEHAKRIEELAERVRPAYAHRLETRLRELMGTVPVDPARVAQEAALLAERGDICEEISRLHSHVQQFEKLLAGAGEAGKKLDFLLQEMQREANTMLSKTPGVEADGLAITDLALEVKSQIEKLREQVQNVE
ncbi:MAG: YicC family protein [Acidobacteria bacterium]|nr:YicC family protein [Acidobacteriota bacterium]MCL5288718.1 YicC family protein [Acidobacteriota bacterium]